MGRANAAPKVDWVVQTIGHEALSFTPITAERRRSRR
jgi:hypothetical protein